MNLILNLDLKPLVLGFKRVFKFLPFITVILWFFPFYALKFLVSFSS